MSARPVLVCVSAGALLLGGCSECPSGGIPSSWIRFSGAASEALPRACPLAVVAPAEERGFLGDLDGDGERDAWGIADSVLGLTDPDTAAIRRPITGRVEVRRFRGHQDDLVVIDRWSRPSGASVLVGTVLAERGRPHLSLVRPSGDPVEVAHRLSGYDLALVFGPSRFSVVEDDVDGDGIADLLIGAPGRKDTGALFGFRADLGSIAWALPAPPGSLHFGASLAFVEGEAQSGLGDLVVGDPGPEPIETKKADRPGRVHVFSASTRALRYSLCGCIDDDAFGQDIAPVGDVDGDGYGDFAVCAPFTSFDFSRSVQCFGYLRMHSGRDGRELWTVYGDKRRPSIAKCALGVGDVDGDGVDDVVMGISGTSSVAWILSGRTGLAVASLRWPHGAGGYARGFVRVDGVLEDGRAALVVLATAYEDGDQQQLLLFYDLDSLTSG